MGRELLSLLQKRGLYYLFEELPGCPYGCGPSSSVIESERNRAGALAQSVPAPNRGRERRRKRANGQTSAFVLRFERVFIKFKVDSVMGWKWGIRPIWSNRAVWPASKAMEDYKCFSG